MTHATTTVRESDATGADRGDHLRLAGWSGIAFVVLAVVQNVLRTTLLPASDAPASVVAQGFRDHHGALVTLVALFVVAGVALSVFLGGVWTRITSAAPSWAQTGIVGAIGTFAIFPVLVSCEVALMTVAGRASPDLAAVDVLWTLHNAIFAINSLALAVAVLGLSTAAVRAGAAPGSFATTGPIGAALLVVGAVGAPMIARGAGQPLYALMGLGYLSWLVLVTSMSVRLTRRRLAGSTP